MKQKIKNWIKKWLEIPAIVQKPISREEQPKDAPFFLVNRHYLASINPEDADEYLDKLDENGRKEYEAECAMVFSSKAFRQEMKHLIALQSLFIGAEASNWDQTLIGRGTINGIGLVEDRFKLLNARHLENINPQDKPVDKFSLLP